MSFKQQYKDRSVLYRAGGLLNMQLLSSSFLAFSKAQYTQHNACALVGPDNFTIYTGRCVYLHLFADIILTWIGSWVLVFTHIWSAESPVCSKPKDISNFWHQFTVDCCMITTWSIPPCSSSRCRTIGSLSGRGRASLRPERSAALFSYAPAH